MRVQNSLSPFRAAVWKPTTPRGHILLWTAPLIVGLLCVFIVRSGPRHSPFQTQSVLTVHEWLEDALSSKVTCDDSASLDAVIDRAAMADGTVILSSFTAAISPMFDLFLTRIRQQPSTLRLLRHTVIVAFDQEGYQYCCQQGLHCFYQKLMWARMEIVRDILKSGHHILITDLDILWFKNPFPYFHNKTDWDIAFMVDIWNGWDPSVCRANCGFFLARSTPRAIDFVDFWIRDHDQKYPDSNEQVVLNHLLPRNASSADPMKKLRIAYLHPDNFGSKCVKPQRVEEMVIFHATCCGEPAPVKISMLRNVEAMYERQMGMRELEEGEVLSGNFGWNFSGC